MSTDQRGRRKRALAAFAWVVAGALLAGAAESGLYLQAWRVPVAEEQFISWHLEEHAVPAVHVGARLVFAGSTGGVMRAFDMVSGAEIWKFSVGAPIESEPLADDGHLYFGASDGALYALSMYTGKLDWKYQTGSLITARPVIEGGRLFVQTRQNQVLALDKKTGKWLWHYQREQPAGFTVEGVAGPVVAQGLVYAGFSDGWAAALNIDDGAPAWARKLTKKSQFTDAWWTPVVQGDRLYVAVYSDGVVCLDAKKGTELWRADLPGASAPLVSGDRLMVTTSFNEVVALDRFGKVAARRDLGGGAFTAPFAAGDGYLAFSSSHGPVYVVKRSDLKVAQVLRPGTGVCGRPVMTQRSLYFISNRGVLYKYSQF